MSLESTERSLSEWFDDLRERSSHVDWGESEEFIDEYESVLSYAVEGLEGEDGYVDPSFVVEAVARQIIEGEDKGQDLKDIGVFERSSPSLDNGVTASLPEHIKDVRSRDGTFRKVENIFSDLPSSREEAEELLQNNNGIEDFEDYFSDGALHEALESVKQLNTHKWFIHNLAAAGEIRNESLNEMMDWKKEFMKSTDKTSEIAALYIENNFEADGIAKFNSYEEIGDASLPQYPENFVNELTETLIEGYERTISEAETNQREDNQEEEKSRKIDTFTGYDFDSLHSDYSQNEKGIIREIAKMDESEGIQLDDVRSAFTWAWEEEKEGESSYAKNELSIDERSQVAGLKNEFSDYISDGENKGKGRGYQRELEELLAGGKQLEQYKQVIEK